MKFHRLLLFGALLIFCAAPTFGQTSRPLVVVSNLTALSARVPVTGETVWVAGRTNAGDGFQGFFKHNASGSTNALGFGAVCFACSSGGTYDRITTDPIDPRWWGAVPYQTTNGVMNPYGAMLESTAIGTGDFSVWMRAEFPSDTDDWQGGFILTQSTNCNSFKSAFEFRIAGGVDGAFGFVFRGTNGASSAGSTIVESSVLDASYSDFPELVGEVADIVVTRAGSVPKVYINGVDVTSDFTHGNATGWAKSLALGEAVGIQVGGNNNQWYWKQPIHRFAVFNRAVSGADLANLTNASGQVVSWAGSRTEPPADTSAAINSALQYARAVGAKHVELAAGAWYITNRINHVPGVALKGRGTPSHYPGHFSSSTAPTDIVLGFGADHDAIGAEFTSAIPDSFFDPVNTGMGVMFNRYFNATIEDLRIYGALARSSRGIFLDRVGSITVRNVQFDRIPNYAIWSMFGNGMEFENLTGTTYGGIWLCFYNDTKLSGSFIDGTYGPVLTLNNVSQSRFIGNTFDVSFNPADGGFYSRYGTVTANATTDVLTKSNHRYKTGDVVWFSSTGTLPAGLSAETDYFVYRLTDDTFKVSTLWTDVDSGEGALNGVGLDITDTGSGTHSVNMAGPAVGIYVYESDRNMISDTRSVFGWDGQIQIKGGEQNMLQNIDAVASGILPLGNNTSTNIAALRIINSPENKIDGGSFGSRNGAGEAQYGIVFEGSAVSNQVSNVSLDAPVSAGGITNNDVRRPAVFGSDGFVPLSPFVFEQAPVLLRYKAPGTILSRVTAQGAAVWEHEGVFADNSLRFNASGTNSGEGVRWSVGRNRATYGEYGAVQQGDQIFELFGRAWHGTNAIDYHDGVFGLEFYAANVITSNSAPTSARLKLVPSGSTTRQTYYDFTTSLLTAGGAIYASNYVTAGGDITSAGIVWMTNDAPRLIWKELDAPTTNEIRWDARLVDGHWRLSLYNGSDVFVEDAIDIDRNGGSPTTFVIKGTSLLWNDAPVWHSDNTGIGLTNDNATLALNIVWGANLSAATNGTEVTVSASGGGGTNSASLFVNGVEVTGANITNTAQITWGTASSNVTATIVAGSVGATELEATTVVAGSYTNPIVTFDADGRATAAESGAASITSWDELTDVPASVLALTNLTEQRIYGRGEGDGDGPAIQLETQGSTYITNFWDGPAFGFNLITTDIPLLSQENVFTGATNTFRTIVATNFAIDQMSVTDLDVSGDFTANGTNLLALILGASQSAGSKTIARFLPIDATFTTNTTGYATYTVRGDGHRALQFDGTASECAFFDGVIPEGAVLTSGINVSITEVSTATSGTNVFSVEFERLTTDIDANSFATATNIVITPSGTSGVPTRSSVTSTFLDSLTEEDDYRIRVCRLPGDASDTFTNHVGVLRIVLKTAD